ncbi:lipoyl(octanoyl) transferase LipB [Candidatus Poribacteria bacterium]
MLLTDERISHEKDLNLVKLGIVDYGPAHRLQERLVQEHIQGNGSNSLLLLQHNPVITIGRSGSRDNILASRSALAAAGIDIYEIERGGDVTYHGPGQLTGYPIINLRYFKKDVHWYLRQLEETIIKVLAEYSIIGTRMDGYTGVWVGNEKVAAIGVAIRRWITYHGFALNVHPDMSHFQMIRPCGITDKGVTSIERLLGHRVDMDGVIDKTASAFAEVMNVNRIHVDATDI